MAFARRYWDIPSGLRNSSSRISPGVEIYGLVVVTELDLPCLVASPYEAEAPAVVHTDAIPTRPVSPEQLQAITRRDAEVPEIACGVEHLQFSVQGPSNVRWNPLRRICGIVPEPLKIPVLESHGTHYFRITELYRSTAVTSTRSPTACAQIQRFQYIEHMFVCQGRSTSRACPARQPNSSSSVDSISASTVASSASACM